MVVVPSQIKEGVKHQLLEALAEIEKLQKQSREGKNISVAQLNYLQVDVNRAESFVSSTFNDLRSVLEIAKNSRLQGEIFAKLEQLKRDIELVIKVF